MKRNEPIGKALFVKIICSVICLELVHMTNLDEVVIRTYSCMTQTQRPLVEPSSEIVLGWASIIN